MSAQAKLIAPRVAGLVLAAGRSARMGAAHNKLTTRVDGEPLVTWPVDAMLGAGVEYLVVVTGFEASSIEAALAGRECAFAYHAEWAEGMGASLAFGARQIMAEEEVNPGRFDALMLGLGDLPGLRSSLVAQLLEAAGPEPMRDRIVVPAHGGRSGHPVIWGRRFWPQLAALSGDAGAKRVLASEADSVTQVDLRSDAVCADIDTPDDLAGWQAEGE